MNDKIDSKDGSKKIIFGWFFAIRFLIGIGLAVVVVVVILGLLGKLV